MVNTAEATVRWHAWRRRGDERAFEALVRGETRYAADLARRMGASDAEAEDAVQDALLKLAREPTDAPVEVGIRAWLCRRVVLGFKMQVRSNVRRRRHERAAPPPRATRDPTRRLEASDRVQAALDRLDGLERQAVVLRYLHDLDYREMAYVLGTTENACRLRVHRGLKHLRARLGDKAAALVAIVPIPVLGTEAALTATAVKAATGTAAVLGAKGLAGLGVGLLAAAAVVVAVAVPRDEAPPPSEVAGPPPVAAPVVVPPTRPDPPPPPPAAPPRPATRPESAALALLDAHLAGTQDAADTLWRFDDLVRALGEPRGVLHVPASEAASTPLDLSELTETAERIVLGPGTYHVERGARLRPGLVLEIAGAGPDETTLTSYRHNVVYVGEALSGFLVRDLTFESARPGHRDEGCLLDVRGRAAAAFDNVRFPAWIHRAGYSAPVGNEGRAILAFRDCVFLGGYRRRPGGCALAARGDTLYLFERCRFVDLSEVVASRTSAKPSPRSLGHFHDCVFDNAPCAGEGTWPDALARYPVHVRGGRVLQGGRTASREERVAAWNGRRVTASDDVRFEPETVRCTPVEVRRVLETWKAPPGRRIVGVEVIAWPGRDEPRYVVHQHDAEGTLYRDLVRLGPGGAETASAECCWMPGRLPLTPGRGATLLDLLREAWDGLDMRMPVGAVGLHGAAGEARLHILTRRDLAE